MGKYDPWDPFFAGIEADDVTFDMAELEEVLGQPLPPSARRYQAWWTGAHYYAKWAAYGFSASPDLRRQRVRFRRRSRVRREESGSGSAKPGATGEVSERRLILVGCVGQKRPVSSPAKDMYISPLWEKRRAYAEATGMPWAILSAEYGLVMPDQVIEPYDRSLRDETPAYRREWSEWTARAVVDLCRQLDVSTVEAHAGSAYMEHGLIGRLNAAGIRVLWPLRGLRIGEQLAWYDEHTPDASTSPPAPTPAGTERPSGPAPSGPIRTVGPGGSRSDDIEIPVILEMRRVGPFSYRWPDATEAFRHGWEGTCSFDGRTVAFRHGVGGRQVYGAERVHTVTWVADQPAAEGVAADDYLRTRGLLSLIKTPAGTMARTVADVPAGYGAFTVVDHRAEIDAPYSRRGMAVKIRVDDVAAWLHHALLRRRGGSGPSRPEPPPDPPPYQPPPAGGPAGTTAPLRPAGPAGGPRQARYEPLPAEQKRLIAERLVAFGDTDAVRHPDVGPPEYTSDPEANQFLVDDPFAFLVAVLCDQGVKAEKAWAAPLELSRRLGHLDPRRMLADPEAVIRAFREPAPLHRFVDTVPRWILSAADRVLRQYGGDAGRIWGDRPAAAELQERFRAFDGIGQKKAAMAVELLANDFGVEIRQMEGSDIAYDVHVRRVFLRTGLAERDDVAHMVGVARQIYPERPGALDGPAWVIGRTWCRPADPRCGECVLDEVCAHRIDAGAQVKGV